MDEMPERPQFLTTREVAALLRVRERKVYDLAGAGEIPCRRVTGKLLFPREEIEAWLAGEAVPSTDTATALTPAPAQTAVPRSTPVPPIIAGSHDPLLDWALRASGSALASFFDGSLDGLDRLARGEAAAAGVHLHEPGEEGVGWNTTHVAQACAGRPVVLIEWARRQRGLILAPALSGEIRGIADLAGRRIALRQPRAGSAHLFHRLMAEAGLAEEAILPLPEPARTETEAAEAIATGRAEAAPGLASVARAHGLAFLPLIEERFDLVLDRGAYFEPPLQALMAFTRTRAFADRAAALEGYDVAGLGTVHWNAA
ncbi:MAG: helix-turn-helix transcriptional regulator [Pseudomonadota bacterium]